MITLKLHNVKIRRRALKIGMRAHKMSKRMLLRVLISAYVKEKDKLEVILAKLNAEIEQMEYDPGLDEDEDAEIVAQTMQVWILD
ncbi:hypothetical protein LIER_27326 [Lithospermum erythrorhizon]|uniref:Uncharacterized protein n=1 Tax=Lithospermum erythrorhizon TaxID=34254 RepID=A0AAV3RFP1_LITER